MPEDAGMARAPLRERWLIEQLRPVRESIAAKAVVIDPDGLLDMTNLAADRDLVRATDWRELRQAFEEHRRGRAPRSAPQVIHLTSADFSATRDLPWDIEQRSAVAVVRWPYSRAWLDWRRSLDPDRSGRLSALLEQQPAASVSTAIQHLFNVSVAARSPAAEIAVVVELRRQSFPSELWPHVRDLLSTPEALGIAQDPPDVDAIQRAWKDWLAHGEQSPAAALVADNSGALIALLQDGLLTPVPSEAPGLPAWARLGSLDVGPAERAGALLANAPEAWPPSDIEGWFAFASWWGDVRAQLAAVAPRSAELQAQADEWWQRADTDFRPWIRDNYGLLLTSTRARPVTVDKIAAFLARRLRGEAERVMLVVLDGLGMSQWADLRSRCGLEVVEPGACLAMVPTLTEHSRQAIFAGAPPIAFAGDLANNEKEERHWRAFWTGEGLGVTDIGYFKDRGASAAAVPRLGAERAFGVVALAVDQMLHESKVLPDPQLAAAVRTWADHGFLTELVKRATDEGFEVWLTSDHGNLEAQPLGLLQEGETVDRAGRRVRFYANSTLRERSAERHNGDIWDPPGFPVEGRFPLFARARGAWILGGAQVIHGGLSLDEMIVPLVRVRR